MAELMRDDLQILAQFQAFANGGAIICYLTIVAKFIARKFFKHANSTIVSQVDMQVLKAVGLILLVQSFMWILGNMFVGIFLLKIIGPLDTLGSQEISINVGTVVSFLSALEVPILYWTSSLHRAALKNELKWLENIFPKNNQVQNIVIVKPARP